MSAALLLLTTLALPNSGHLGTPFVAKEKMRTDCRSNPHLLRATSEYERGDLPRTVRSLQRAIEYARNCRYDLARIYELKAFVDALSDERERCKRAFEFVLVIHPDYELSKRVPEKIKMCRHTVSKPPVLEMKLDPVEKRAGYLRIRGTVEDELRASHTVRVVMWTKSSKAPFVTTGRVDSKFEVPMLAPPEPAEVVVALTDRWGGVLRVEKLRVD